MRTPAWLALFMLCWPGWTTEFSGEKALEFTRRAVAFGPRPPGSAALRQLRGYIVHQLRGWRWEVSADTFLAQTPAGPVEMSNIVARVPGVSGRAVVFSGHYDTKRFPLIRFVGANDGGASTGFLLEMARVLSGKPRKDDVYLVWFDGEEAIGEWSETDGIYGSRHLAAKWAADGTLGRIKALVNVDMIGDKNLGILKEGYSHPGLQRLIWLVARDLGLSRYFLSQGGPVEDDHVPFVRRGLPAVNLIDFDYPVWHTERDTIDKLSASSFEVVGRVLLEALRRLELSAAFP